MVPLMEILFLASEVAPFSKTGGLGDVSAALPRALASLGHTVKLVTPLYASVSREGLERTDTRFDLRFAFGTVSFGLWRTTVSMGCEVWFLENDGLYGRAGLYGDPGAPEYADSAHRFAALSMGALTAAQVLGFEPDIVHANDWQTGLTPLALKHGFAHTALGRAKSVFTIHNLAYQGVFPKSVLGDLGIPWELFRTDGLEFYDQLSFLKAGLVYSDVLTTVSPRYATEIKTPEAGWGMDGLLRHRSDALTGILNGIDVQEWNPRTDPHLPARYAVDDLAGKAVCKRELLAELGLGGERRPFFGFVGRLAEQKGIGLIRSVIPTLVQDGGNVVVVGMGDPTEEQALRALAAQFPGRVAVRIAFDPALSHRVEAGLDFFLMPSLFEPCGLNQLYSLRYGTIPIVRAVGGLRDTVTDMSTPGGTGFLFEAFDPEAFRHATRRAFALYEAGPKILDEARRRGMRQDFSWDRSARRYVEVYAARRAEAA